MPILMPTYPLAFSLAEGKYDLIPSIQHYAHLLKDKHVSHLVCLKLPSTLDPTLESDIKNLFYYFYSNRTLMSRNDIYQATFKNSSLQSSVHRTYGNDNLISVAQVLLGANALSTKQAKRIKDRLNCSSSRTTSRSSEHKEKPSKKDEDLERAWGTFTYLSGMDEIHEILSETPKAHRERTARWLAGKVKKKLYLHEEKKKIRKRIAEVKGEENG